MAFGRKPDGVGTPSVPIAPSPGSTNVFYSAEHFEYHAARVSGAGDVKFTVNAVVTDLIGVASVTLHYSATGAGPRPSP